MATQTQIAAVQQLYIGYLGRAADKAGLDFWTNAVATGVSTLESVATGFTLSNEYKAAFGGLTNDALVEKVYTSVLGRASDTAGKAFWVDALAKGTVTADKLVATFIGALSAPDQTIINNKTFVAQTYTDTVGADYNAEAGAAVIANVTNDPATVAAALETISNGTLSGLVPGISLINAQAAADAAVVAYEKSLATSNAALDTSATKGQVDASEIAAGLQGAENDRVALFGTDPVVSTAVAKALLADAVEATADAKASVIAADKTNGAKLIAAYDNAATSLNTLVGDATAQAATSAAKAAALAGFAPAATTTVTYAALEVAAGVAPGSFTTSANVFAALTGSALTPAQHAALVAEVNKAGVAGTNLVAAADKEVAIADANKALLEAESALAGVGDSPAIIAVGGEVITPAVLATQDDVAASATVKLGDVLVAAVVAAGGEVITPAVLATQDDVAASATVKLGDVLVEEVLAVGGEEITPAVLATQADVDAGTAVAVGDVITPAEVATAGDVLTPAVVATQADVDASVTLAVGDVVTPAVVAAAGDVLTPAVLATQADVDASVTLAVGDVITPAVVANAGDVLIPAVSGAGQAYIDAKADQVAQTELVTKLVAADTKIALIEAISNTHEALVDAASEASTALDKFDADHTNITINDLSGAAVTLNADAAQSDVFYFSAAPVASTVAIGGSTAATQFGAGDNLVLGNSLSYNSGALSTGDNNKAEFFLVQKGSDTLVILESEAYGSSTTLHTATDDAAAVVAPEATVITLTGVNVADLTVNNGVIAHVA